MPPQNGDPACRSWLTLTVHDGGRAEAGYKGSTGDCVVRSIAIATRKPYQEVYDVLNALAAEERITKRHLGRSTYERYLADIGWAWTPCMHIGQGCKVHLLKSELPSGRLIVRLSKHLTCVIDGVIYDSHDPSRGGTRCVYGYFSKEMRW